MRVFACSFLALALPAFAQVFGCACDSARPETLAARECGLCKEGDKQPAAPAIFFLKDINPRKPNRLLALPRAHGKGPHSLAEMTPAARAELWTAAIEKAKSLWGAQWGVALNGDEVRTQCHMHLHIGKLIEDLETARFVVVDGPAGIPVPPDGSGMWVHPEGNKLHVHLDEQITETVLIR
ncbi:MAG: hypothetical protein HYR60_14235 [Acidobacteria bacterium]|nr:hypothetical protein [Acidobacteriota bacterium]MBI3471598.1 hypothetical protein [Candidatus Solibacter usitatus]